eukprot:9716948-Karenia_brevis.AAC.1
MAWHAHNFRERYVDIFPKWAEIKGGLVLDNAHSRIKDSEIYTHAIRNMFLQGKLGLPPEVNDSRPHDRVNKHEINSGLARPGSGIMSVSGSAV